MVFARIHVVDDTPLAAILAQRLVMEKSHVGFAWSRAKFDAVTRVAVKSAMNLVLLASKSAPGLVHIGVRANYHAQYPVTCFHALNAAP